MPKNTSDCSRSIRYMKLMAWAKRRYADPATGNPDYFCGLLPSRFCVISDMAAERYFDSARIFPEWSLRDLKDAPSGFDAQLNLSEAVSARAYGGAA